MNKRNFLKILDQKLSVLSETERKDIINEYQDIIEQKVKHGKTEEEAVKEFGNIEELTLEILKVYKINPDYNKDNKDFIGGFENAIKNGAKKVSKATEDFIDNINIDNNKLTLQKVFEFVIKLIILLLGLLILKIPFMFIQELGVSLFETTNFSFFKHIWNILIEFIYFVVSITVIIAIIIRFINSIQKNETANQEKDSKLVSKKNNEENKKIESQNNKLSDIIMLIVKIWVFMIILLPSFGIIIGMLIGLCILIYLTIKGILLIGPIILLIGLLVSGIYLIYIILNGLFDRVKIHIYPFIVGLILFIIGSLMTFDYVIGFNFYDSLPKNSKFKIKTISYSETIDEKTKIHYDDINIDNNLKDNEIKMEVKYYPDFIRINGIEKSDIIYEDEEKIGTIYIQSENYYNNIGFNHPIVKEIIKNLNKQEIYDYGQYYNYKVKLYINEKTKRLLVD